MHRLAAITLLTLAIAASVWAQGGTGSINGAVNDGTGAAVPAVTVTLTGTTLIGEQTQTTGEQGLYRFPNLPAGTYKLRFESTGFATLVREQININAGFSAEINVNLSVASQQQTLVVTGETPLVDTENANVQNTVGEQQLANLASSRDMWSVMGVTAGVNVQSLDVGGSAAGTQPTYTAYGYGAQSFAQARVQIDGVNTSEARNAAGFYYDYGSLQEFTVSTAANDASMPVPGVFVNAIVKTGGNQLHSDVYYDYESSNFQGSNIDQRQLQLGAGTGTRITKYRDFDADAGGPIRKDKIWYFASIRDQRLGNTVTGFPANNPGAGPDFSTTLQNLTYKFSGQLSRNHRLSHYLQWGRKNQPYRNAGSTYYADAVYNQNLFSWASNLVYDGVLSPRFFITARAATWGYNWMNTAYAGPSGQIENRRYETQTTNYAGGFAPYRYDRRRKQAEVTGSYFLDDFLGATHQVKFGFQWEHETFVNEEYGPKDQVIQIYNSPAGSPDFTTPSLIALLNGPAVASDYMNHGGSFIQDQIRIKKRVTVNLGVRWDYYRAYEPQQQVRGDANYRGFYYLGQTLPNGFSIPASPNGLTIPARQVLRYPFNIVPRIGVAWDITGKGKTVLKLNWGRFYSNPAPDFGSVYLNGLQYIGGTAGGSGQYLANTAFTFRWNNPTNLPFNASQLGAYVSGSSPSSATVAPHIKDPLVDDAGVFLEQQLSNDLSIRAGFVYRFVHNNWQQVNTALTSNLYTQPVSFFDPGPDGVRGTADDKGNITAYDIPAGTAIPVSTFQMQSPDGNKASYGTFEVTVNKRMSRRFLVVGSYNWTGQHYLINGVPTNPNLAYNNYVKDHYWTAHASGTYRAPWGLMISPILRMQQGQPEDRILNVTGLRVGTAAIPADPFGAWAFPTVYLFDARIEKQFVFREKFRVGAFFDAFNLFNTNAEQNESVTTGVKTVKINGVSYSGPLFLSPTTVLAPRIFRLGVKFSF